MEEAWLDGVVAQAVDSATKALIARHCGDELVEERMSNGKPQTKQSGLEPTANMQRAAPQAPHVHAETDDAVDDEEVVVREVATKEEVEEVVDGCGAGVGEVREVGGAGGDEAGSERGGGARRGEEPRVVHVEERKMSLQDEREVGPASLAVAADVLQVSPTPCTCQGSSVQCLTSVFELLRKAQRAAPSQTLNDVRIPPTVVFRRRVDAQYSDLSSSRPVDWYFSSGKSVPSLRRKHAKNVTRDKVFDAFVTYAEQSLCNTLARMQQEETAAELEARAREKALLNHEPMPSPPEAPAPAVASPRPSPRLKKKTKKQKRGLRYPRRPHAPAKRFMRTRPAKVGSSSRRMIVAQFVLAADSPVRLPGGLTVVYMTRRELRHFLWNVQLDWSRPMLAGCLQAFLYGKNIPLQHRLRHHTLSSTWTPTFQQFELRLNKNDVRSFRTEGAMRACTYDGPPQQSVELSPLVLDGRYADSHNPMQEAVSQLASALSASGHSCFRSKSSKEQPDVALCFLKSFWRLDADAKPCLLWCGAARFAVRQGSQLLQDTVCMQCAGAIEPTESPPSPLPQAVVKAEAEPDAEYANFFDDLDDEFGLDPLSRSGHSNLSFGLSSVNSTPTDVGSPRPGSALPAIGRRRRPQSAFQRGQRRRPHDHLVAFCGACGQHVSHTPRPPASARKPVHRSARSSRFRRTKVW